ncbi:MAG: hypothetical protein KGL91_01245 [Xanthomonadaceae bacterium]|nr:hypothetical protein [Xanthomonadaceae bacterium]
MTYSFGRKKEKNGIRTDWRVRRLGPRSVWLWGAAAVWATLLLSPGAAGVAGKLANRATSNITPLVVRAIRELWSLRFMVNVLLWVFGVVGNYNTMFLLVNNRQPN